MFPQNVNDILKWNYHTESDFAHTRLSYQINLMKNHCQPFHISSLSSRESLGQCSTKGWWISIPIYRFQFHFSGPNHNCFYLVLGKYHKPFHLLPRSRNPPTRWSEPPHPSVVRVYIYPPPARATAVAFLPEPPPPSLSRFPRPIPVIPTDTVFTPPRSSSSWESLWHELHEG